MTRKEFELSQGQLEKLLDAGKSLPYLIIGGHPPPSQQERANDAWKAIAAELGFIWDTVEPVSGKGIRFFTAEVKE